MSTTNDTKPFIASEEARNGKEGVGRKNRRGGNKRARSRSPIERSGGGGGGTGTSSRAARRVYVANVPFDVKWSELKDLFRDKVGNVVYCQLFEDEQGRSRGCGLVEFNDTDSAKKAIEVLHRFEFRNRELVVKEDLDCERDRYGRLLLPGKGRDRDEGPPGPGPGPGDYDHSFDSQRAPPGTWNTYGLSPQFLESLGIHGPLNNRIFVANLEYKVGEKKLEEIFKLAGKVRRAQLTTDNNGQSKGYGTVEFDHPVEAVQGISMFHNQKLYGRPMSIRMDKYECEEVAEVLPTKLPSGLEGIGKGLGIGGQPLNVSKSLLGAGAPAMAPPPIQVPPAPVAPSNALSSLGGINQFSHSLIKSDELNNQFSAVQSALNQLSQPQISSNIAQNPLSGLDQRSSSLSQTMGGNGFSNFSSLNNPTSGAVRVAGLGLGAGSVQPSSVYEREFRDAGVGLRPHGGGVHAVSDTIVVRNLPPSCTWQALKDKFSEIAEVRYAEIKGVGGAIVRFYTERDAQRAVDMMNGVRFGDRIIEVSFFF